MEITIGEKIRRRRKQMRLTLKELAGDKVTPAQISAVEKGKCKPSPGLLEYIAERLEEDVDYFTLTEEERCRKEFDKCKEVSSAFYNDNKYSEAKDNIRSMVEMIPFLREDQKGYFYYIHGVFFYNENKYDEAFDNYMKSLTYYLKTKDLNAIADIYIRIGNSLYCTHKYDMALGYYMSACKYIKEGIDGNISIKALYDVALANLALERYDAVLEYTEKCNTLFMENPQLNKNRYVPSLFLMSGLIDRKNSNFIEATKKFDSSFKLYKDNQDYLGMGRAKHNEALCLWDLGDYKKSLESFNESIEYKSTSNDEMLSDSFICMAERIKEKENVENALRTIEAAEEKILAQGLPKGIIQIFLKKFEYLLEMKEYDRAEIFAFLALDYIQKAGDKKAEFKLYIMLSEMHRNLGDENASLEYLVKANKYI